MENVLRVVKNFGYLFVCLAVSDRVQYPLRNRKFTKLEIQKAVITCAFKEYRRV